MFPVIVEILGPRGRVLHRDRLYKLPAVLGRGYDSDVILDDPFISEAHLRLEEDGDGKLVAVDLNSDNGVRTWPDRKPFSRKSGASELDLLLGRTRVRVRSADFAVKPTRKDAELTGPLHRVLATRKWRLALMLTTFSIIFGEAYLDSTANGLSEGGKALILVNFLISMWCMGWSVTGRLMTNHFRFAEHYAIALSTVALIALVNFLWSHASFAGWLPGGEGMRGFVLVGVFVGVAIWMHLLVMRHHVPRTRAIAAALGICMVLFTALFMQLGSDDDISGALDIDRAMSPLPLSIVSTESLDTFSETIADAADRAAKASKRLEHQSENR